MAFGEDVVVLAELFDDAAGGFVASLTGLFASEGFGDAFGVEVLADEVDGFADFGEGNGFMDEEEVLVSQFYEGGPVFEGLSIDGDSLGGQDVLKDGEGPHGGVMD